MIFSELGANHPSLLKHVALALIMAIPIEVAVAQDSEPDVDPNDYPDVVVEGDDASEFAGLTGTVINRDPNLTPTPRVRVPVRIQAEALLEQADAVGVECALSSRVLRTERGNETVVGTGYAVAIRQGGSTRPFVESDKDVHHTFVGDAVDLTFIVPFFPVEGAPPIEFWTDGECQLMIYKDTAGAYGYPQNCAETTFGVNMSSVDLEKMLACVWPGTDPEDGKVSFVRPGLAAPNPEAGQSSDPGNSSDRGREDQGGAE